MLHDETCVSVCVHVPSAAPLCDGSVTILRRLRGGNFHRPHLGKMKRRERHRLGFEEPFTSRCRRTPYILLSAHTQAHTRWFNFFLPSLFFIHFPETRFQSPRCDPLIFFVVMAMQQLLSSPRLSSAAIVFAVHTSPARPISSDISPPPHSAAWFGLILSFKFTAAVQFLFSFSSTEDVYVNLKTTTLHSVDWQLR